MRTTGRTVWWNGAAIPEREARVSIFDASLQSGDIIYESCRTFGHRPFRLHDHLRRLENSLRFVQIPLPWSREELSAAVNSVLEENLPTEAEDVDWQIQINVFRGLQAPYGCLANSLPSPDVFINCWPLINILGPFADFYDRGVSLMIPSQRALPAELLCGKAKTRSRPHFRLAQLQAKRMGGNCWPLLLDPDGFLAEGPTWSVLIVKEGTLYAPEPRNVLHGVSSSVVRELAHQCGIPFAHANLDRYDALMADEILCLATSFCLVHAVRFEGQAIRGELPGPIYGQLTQAWTDLVGIDFVSQSRSYRERYAEWERRQSASQ